MTDGQVNHAAGSGKGVYRVLGLVLLCLLAGAAGGLSYAAWSAGRAPSGLSKTKVIGDPDYVTALELGMRGKMRDIRIPAGYKVRIVYQLWAKGGFERYEAEDVWPIDPNAPWYLRLGVKTYDPREFQRNPGREIKVTFCRGSEYHEGWYEIGFASGRIGSTMADSDVELSAEDVGRDELVSCVVFGGWTAYTSPAPKIPTAVDLKNKTVGLYAGVWVRLEELTPEDRNTPDSETLRIGCIVIKPIDPNVVRR